MPFGYELIIITIMIFFNAIFASYEMALASIPRSRIAFLVSEKKLGANEAAFMKDRMGASLAVIQFGITLVGAFAAATGGAGVGEKFGPYLKDAWHINANTADFLGLVFFIIPLSLVTILFGELVPKMFALSNKEWVILQLSPAMKLLAFITRPVITVIENFVKRIVGYGTKKWNTKENVDKKRGLYELMAAVTLARSSQLLGAHEEKIVLSAANLSMRPVKEIIIPAHEICTLPYESTLQDAFLKAHLDMHTRFPVAIDENDPDTIKGYINFKDIVVALKINPQDPTVKGIMRPLPRINGSMPISQLLEKMILEKTHIVLVVSDKDSVLGMVALEDIIEELVGEIEDEFDRLPTQIHSYGTSWLMGGGVRMDTVAETLGLDWSGKFQGIKIPTLAEWCDIKMGRQIAGGEIIESDNLIVTPRKFRRKKVSEALVSSAEIPHT